MSETWMLAVAAIGDSDTDDEFRAAVDAALKLAPKELGKLIGYYSGHPSYWNGALDAQPAAVEAAVATAKAG